MPLSSENEFLINIIQVDDFKDSIVFEPLPLASLPPEPAITDEEFEKEIDLMMLDSNSMAADTSSSHDIV
ncbi:hypothetical protein MKW92_039905, partial [Papaver armeniacum]